MHATRRSVLVLAAALAGCATTPAQVATDVELVANGIADVAKAIAAIPGAPASLVAEVQAYALTVAAGAAEVATAASVPTSLVRQIAAAVEKVADLVLPAFPVTAPFVPLVNAALSLLPAILSAVGIASALPALPAYTPAEARLILAGAR